MEIIHIAAECFPFAKAGGLGDVVGALPKYQQRQGHISKVVLPMYRTSFLFANSWDLVHEGSQQLGSSQFKFSVIREKTGKLGFDLYLIDINGLLDRDRIYGYDDDTERFLAFQIAFCDWVNAWNHQPDIIHCHDHQTGLVPFMLKYCYAFRDKLSFVPSVLTIHNAQYNGAFSWGKSSLLPAYDSWKWSMLDWNNSINPLASGVKCAWKVTTVSYSYLEEMRSSSAGLEKLFEYERGKCIGILNGIDNDVWDPATDQLIAKKYSEANLDLGKKENKISLASKFGLDANKPLICFIGRLVGEKAADILPEAIEQSIYQYQGRVNFLVLGSGDPSVERALNQLKEKLNGFYNVFIGYDEALSHLIYAGSDFLLMPSRVEPCGLNQLYALRYGTIPIVRNVGGLRDTVRDMGDWQGTGIRFDNATVQDIVYSVGRAIDLYYHNEKLYKWMRSFSMTMDFSWDKSSKEYIDLYKSLK